MSMSRNLYKALLLVGLVTASVEPEYSPTNYSYTMVENRDSKHGFDLIHNDNQHLLEIESTVFDYTKEKVYGVNLGGWLVTEPFISPSLYLGASKDHTDETTPLDEWSFCESLGKDEATKRLKQHWDTWITEGDFIRIKSFGFNAVRLPIGYWAFESFEEDPYVGGQEEYLKMAIEWCRKHGLKLWIDLHGIPGSQNGFDNSGKRGSREWLSVQKNYDLGIKVLDYIFKTYGTIEYQDVVIGIENLNEPYGPLLPTDKIVQFDYDTYELMNKYSKNNFVFQDAFMPPSFWKDKVLLPRTVLDNHYYACFTVEQMKSSIDENIQNIRNLVNEMKAISRTQIVGEWSGALTDCTKWLNGVGRGSRYNNSFEDSNEFIGECTFSNDVSKMTGNDKDKLAKYIEAQVQSYSELNGYFYWTWKTEDAIEWSLTDLIDLGLFPTPNKNDKGV